MGALHASPGRLQRGMNGPEQDLIAERFVQKGHRARSQSPRVHLGIAMGRDEHERNVAIGRRQLPLELQAADPRHPHVDDEAGRVLQMPGMLKVLRRGERFSSEPHRSDETLDSLADGLVIVDNRGQGNLTHAGPRTPGAVLGRG